MSKSLNILINESKLTIIGFSMSEAFEYVDKLWKVLRKNIPKKFWNRLTIEVSGISNLSELSFKWSISLDISKDGALFEEVLLILTERNFLTDKEIEII